MTSKQLQIGQTLFCVPSHHRGEPYNVMVAKIGRRWATLASNQGRIDLDTLRLDGGDYGSPGRCYLCREDWERETRDDRAWTTFRLRLTHQRPSHITEANVMEAAGILGISLDVVNG